MENKNKSETSTTNGICTGRVTDRSNTCHEPREMPIDRKQKCGDAYSHLLQVLHRTPLFQRSLADLHGPNSDSST